MDIELFNKINIPFPSDMTKFEPILNKLMKCHKMKSELESSLPQKEKAICDLIKKLTDEGEEGVDYDSHKLGNVCETRCGSKMNLQNNLVNFSKYKIIRTRNLSDNNDDYLYLNDEGIKKCENCILSTNDIIISSFIDSYQICIVPNKWNGSTFNGGIFRLKNFKNISNKYIFYYAKTTLFQSQLKCGGSTVDMFNINNLNKIIIKVPKPQIMKKHKIQELFDEVDKMREDIETNKSDYEKLSNEFMLMIDPNYKKDELVNEQQNEPNNDSDNKSNDEPLDEVEEVKPTKKITVKKVIKKKNLLSSKAESTDDN
jgi:hypothetical protein